MTRPPMVQCTDVIAYCTEDGDTFCLDCSAGYDTDAENVHPFFAGDECNQGLYCSGCHTEIVEPMYSVGSNLSGLYLPDSEPHSVHGWDAARDALLAELEHAIDSDWQTFGEEEVYRTLENDPDADGMTAERVRQWQIAKQYVAEHARFGHDISVSCPDGRTYWLQKY